MNALVAPDVGEPKDDVVPTPSTSRKGKALKPRAVVDSTRQSDSPNGGQTYESSSDGSDVHGTDVDRQVSTLSSERDVIRKKFKQAHEVILQEITDKGPRGFVEVLIRKLEQWNTQSTTLTTQISMLLDLAEARIDWIIQEDFNDALRVTKAEFASAYPSCTGTHVASSDNHPPSLGNSTTPPTKRRRIALNVPNDYDEHALITDTQSIAMINNSRAPAPDDWIDRYVQGIKLPDKCIRERPSIPLSQYDGSSLNWFKWIGMVEAIVHNTSMLPAEKLTMLENSLTGKCSGMIQCVGGGEAAYKDILKRLKENCGDRRAIRAAHVTSLRQLYPGKSQSDFVRFAESVRSHLFGISQISRENDSSHPDIIGEVCSKLNSSLVETWYANELSETGSLNDFGSWLCKKARLQLNPYNAGKEDATPSKSVKSHNTSFHASKISADKSRGCLFCSDKTHNLSKCQKFFKEKIEDKIRFLIKTKACFNCLARGHRSINCKQEKHCRVKGCEVKHNYTLHEKYPNPQRITKSTNNNTSSEPERRSS